jgi:hypothetical protein
MCTNFLSICFFSFGLSSLSLTLLILSIAQETSFWTSDHRCSIDFEFRTTIMSLKSSLKRDAARQGPAVGVIPVLSPE